MSEFFSHFHFLRPYWLLMIIPCLISLALLWRQNRGQGSWSRVIAPELLQHLLQGQNRQQVRWPLMLLATGWLLACIALAGPSWQKVPTPVSKSRQPLVVVTDLSYTMYASDMSPNRLARTRYKLLDLFRLRQDGLSALVAYAGDAHTVAPLTDDSRTLANLVPALSPKIMPEQGKNPVAGIELALQLLEQGAGESGDIVLITDAISESDSARIRSLLEGSNHQLSILGVGTESGAPIPIPGGGFIKDRSGAIVIPQLERQPLQRLTQILGGTYRDLAIDDSDLKAILPPPGSNDETVLVERHFDQWHDAGYWLVLLLLPLALTGFRRGWLVLLFVGFTLPSPQAEAFEWRALWKNSNQRAMEALQDKDPKRAAGLFQDSDWKAEALYQSEQYAEAAKAFAKDDSARGYYNQGNALAKAGKLDDAIKAYDKALTKQPGMEDAKFNRELLEKLKQQQEQNQDQQNQSGQDQQQNQDNQNQDKQSQNQQNEKSQNEQGQQGDKQSEQSSDSDQSQSQSQGDREQSEQQKQPSASQQEKEQKQSEEQQQAAAGEEQQNPEGEQQQLSQKPFEAMEQSTPDQQAIENWLQTIPDDPGGLLRRKFLQQQQQREQQRRQEQAW